MKRFLALILLLSMPLFAQAEETCNAFFIVCGEGKECHELYYEVDDHIQEIDATTTAIYDEGNAFIVNVGYDTVLGNYHLSRSCNEVAKFSGYELPIEKYREWADDSCSSDKWKAGALWGALTGLVAGGLIAADCILTACTGTALVSSGVVGTTAVVAGTAVAASVGAVGILGAAAGKGYDYLKQKTCMEDSRTVRMVKSE